MSSQTVAATPSPATPRAKSKLEYIQAFRGVAALLVVLYHGTDQSFVKIHEHLLGDFFYFGSHGVDFFFVLSGFIIYLTHHSDLRRPERLLRFVYKRAVRILPVYWLIMALLTPAIFVLPQLGTAHERQISVILQSWLLIPMRRFPVLGVAWTLSHEMLFYLFFACLIGLRGKLTLRVGLMATMVSAYQLVRVSATAQPFHSLYAEFLFSPYNLEFFAGCVIAHYRQRFEKPRIAWLLVPGILLFLAFGEWDKPLEILLGKYHSVLTFGPASCLLIVGALSLDFRGLTPPLRRLSLMLGDASYSIYLIHNPVVVLTFSLFVRLGFNSAVPILLLAGTAMLVSVTAGTLLHYMIEQPILDRLRKRIPA